MVTEDVREIVCRHFARMGADACFIEDSRPRSASPRSAGVRVGIGGAERLRRYEITVLNPGAEIQVLDARPKERHLLLGVRAVGSPLERYLCGHDERDWFVAAVSAGSSVEEAKESLKPAAVRAAQDRAHLTRKERGRRKTPAYVRQGEWFFLPRPEFRDAGHIVLRSEPIQRSNGTPHLCEFLVRDGGEPVYVCPRHRQGLTQREYERLLQRRPEAAAYPWQTFRRNARVLVKGRITHRDHKTVVLAFWHEVLMNTESGARHAQQVVFLD